MRAKNSLEALHEQAIARELPRRARGPRPVPGRSAWPAPAARENHRGPRPCAAAAGGDRPRSESDRFMVPMHSQKRKEAFQEERNACIRRPSRANAMNDQLYVALPHLRSKA